MVPITHEQNIIYSKTRLDGTTHEQTIICRQLFAGHVVDSRPIEREEKTHRMIIVYYLKYGFMTGDVHENLICSQPFAFRNTEKVIYCSFLVPPTTDTVGQLQYFTDKHGPV